MPAWPDPLDFKRWMALVGYRNRTGVNYLTPSVVTDLVALPQGPFVMLDVDDGYNRRNIAPVTNRENIKAEGRTPFNVRMGVSYFGDHAYAVDGNGMDGPRRLAVRRKVRAGPVPLRRPAAQLQLGRPCESGVGRAVVWEHRRAGGVMQSMC